MIAGLDPKTFEPFICSLDLIGCPMVTEDFVVSGTCAEQMYGMCESLWEPDMVSGAQEDVLLIPLRRQPIERKQCCNCNECQSEQGNVMDKSEACVCSDMYFAIHNLFSGTRRSV